MAELGPRLFGSFNLAISIYYVMAGLDPATHAAPATSGAPSIVRHAGRPELRHRVGARIKSAHDVFGGKSQEPELTRYKPGHDDDPKSLSARLPLVGLKRTRRPRSDSGSRAPRSPALA